MKRTYWLAVPNHDAYNTFRVEKKITCEVVGEWAEGHAKIWQDENGEQYYCFRLEGIYYFAHA